MVAELQEALQEAQRLSERHQQALARVAALAAALGGAGATTAIAAQASAASSAGSSDAPVAHEPLHTAATFIQCRFRGYQTRLVSLANALVPPASAVAAPPSSVIVDGDAAIGLTPEDARQLERLRVEQSAEHSIPCLGFGHTRATLAARRHAQTDWSI